MGFTKIFKQINHAILGYHSSDITLSDITYKDISGTEYTGVKISSLYYPAPLESFPSPASYFTTTSTTMSSMTFFKIGYGSAAPTDQDYELEHPYVPATDYSAVASGATLSYDTVSKKTYRSVALTITANTDLTIREIGLYGTFGTANPYKRVLIYRTALTSAITLSAGQSVTLNLRIAGG